MSKGLSIVVGLIALVIVGVLITAMPRTSNQGYAPEQPIPFSHKIHAGDNKIGCQYCHSNVEKSRHASVPPLNVCMNCHTVVKADSPWIQEIQNDFGEGRAIEWNRVHELPDFVYFPHKRHVAKGVACQSCHGPVETMDRVYQYGALTMGWCMECHRGRSTPPEILKAHVAAGGDPNKVAPTNCSTCHY